MPRHGSDCCGELAVEKALHSTFSPRHITLIMSCGMSSHAQTAGVFKFMLRFRGEATEENGMSIGTIILIILVLVLVGALPTWPHSSGWGYGPSGGLGLIGVILLILVVLGKI